MNTNTDTRMTNTMRDRFEEWCVDNDREATRFPDGNYSVQPFSSGDAWDCYRTAHADMLPVLERVRDALINSQGLLVETGYDYTAEDCKQALTELEAIMKGEKV